MTSTRARLLAALVAVLGLTAMSPAFAAGGAQHPQPSAGKSGPTLDFRRATPGGAFRFAEFSCHPRAADRMDKRLDRMASRLDLSTDQLKLFEDFRTTALTAQTDFSDTCADIRPERSAGKSNGKRERPDLIQMLEQRLKFDEARLAAMTELLPQFKAFYESLSAEQKAGLTPRRGFRQGLEAPQPGKHHRPGGAPDAPAPGLDG